MTDKEKLDKMKKLADAMYYAAQYLTTDASGLRKAMDEYKKFIVYEYRKQEPASEDLEEAAEECVDGEDYPYTDGEGMPLYTPDYLTYMFKQGAQWQREQMMKDAIEGQVERGYCEDGISEHFEVFAYLSGRDERFKDLSDGQSVKVIIVKE